jgi:hypothetical protein
MLYFKNYSLHADVLKLTDVFIEVTNSVLLSYTYFICDTMDANTLFPFH